MLLELIGATCFTLFATAFSGQKTEDGLELPADPQQRARVLVSHCLTQLKPLLVDAAVARVEPHRVVFPDGAELQFAQGEVRLRSATGEEQLLGRLGAEGLAEFQLTSAESLQVTLRAVAEAEARHQVTLRLPVRATPV